MRAPRWIQCCALAAIAACGGREADLLVNATAGDGDASTTRDAGSERDAARQGDGSDATHDAANGDGADGRDATALDATSAPPDDPCPAHVDVNCSRSCGGPSTSCDDVTCSPLTRVTLHAVGDLPYVMRTPAAPGVDARCVAQCGPQAPVFGMAVRIDDPYIVHRLRARVAPPWRISRVDPLEPYCFTPPPATCVATTDKFLTLLVATDDPNAPAHNVMFEDTQDDCP